MRSNKWLILALALSLGVNIAFIGFMAGRASHFHVRPMALDPTVGFARILPELPKARYDALRPLVRQQMRTIMPSIREIRRAQRDLREALLAEPFDPHALEGALARFRQNLSEAQAASHASFVALVEKLTPQERKLLVKVLQREPRLRHGPRRGADRPAPDPRSWEPGVGPQK